MLWFEISILLMRNFRHFRIKVREYWIMLLIVFSNFGLISLKQATDFKRSIFLVFFLQDTIRFIRNTIIIQRKLFTNKKRTTPYHNTINHNRSFLITPSSFSSIKEKLWLHRFYLSMAKTLYLLIDHIKNRMIYHFYCDKNMFMSILRGVGGDRVLILGWSNSFWDFLLCGLFVSDV